MNTEQMLIECSRARYREARNTIGSELSMLDSCIVVLEGIGCYRKIFESSYCSDFFHTVVDSCLSSGVMIICRIWENKSTLGSGNCTFEYLYDFIQENLEEKYKSLWCDQFDDLAPKGKREKIPLEICQAVRHKHIAHSDVGVHVSPTQQATASDGNGTRRESELKTTRLASQEFKLAYLKEPTDLSVQYLRKIDPHFYLGFRKELMVESVVNTFDTVALKSQLVGIYKTDNDEWNRIYADEFAGTDVEELIQQIHERHPSG